MRWLLTTVCLLASLTPVLAQDYLPARPIEVPPATVPNHGPWSFDLIDFREEERLARAHVALQIDVDRQRDLENHGSSCREAYVTQRIIRL